MKAFLAKRLKGKLYVEASDVPALVEAEIARRRLLDRPAEPDETVLAIMAAARVGDAADIAKQLRKWANDDRFAYGIPACTQDQARRAAELLQSIADEG